VKMTIPFLQDRNGKLRYRRKVPAHLRPYLSGRTEIVQALGLRSNQQAAAVGMVAAIDRSVSQLLLDAEKAHRANADPHAMAALAEAWAVQNKYIGHDRSGAINWDGGDSEYDRWVDSVVPTFRDREADLSDLSPLDQMKVETVKRGRRVPVAVTIARAVEAYAEHRSDGKLKQAEGGAINQFYQWIQTTPYVHSAAEGQPSALPVKAVTRQMASEFVLHLHRDIGQGGATIRRRLQSLRAIFNFAIDHFEDSQLTNPWAKLKAPKASESLTPEAEKRLPFNRRHLGLIDTHLRRNSTDPHQRMLLRMLKYTGARPSEITGLTRADVFVNDAVPWMWIRPNAIRGLKNKASSRRIPIASQIVEDIKALIASAGYTQDAALFPKALRNSKGASVQMNALLRAAGIPKSTRLVVYSLRHGMIEALRQSGTLDHVQNAITGHADGKMSARYGAGGLDMRVMAEALEAAIGRLGNVPEHVYENHER